MSPPFSQRKHRKEKQMMVSVRITRLSACMHVAHTKQSVHYMQVHDMYMYIKQATTLCNFPIGEKVMEQWEELKLIC